MTYIEKLKQAIKMDKELLPDSSELIEKTIEMIIENSCPRDFFKDAPDQDLECMKRTCADCWNSEEQR